MNLSLELLKINNFKIYPNNTNYVYFENSEYRIILKPKYQDTNYYIWNMDFESFKNPDKYQLTITNIKTISMFLKVLSIFDIDFKFKV